MTALIHRKAWLVVVLVLLLFTLSSVVIAQDETPDCPSNLEGEPVGCAHIYLPDEALLGDFYLDGELIFAQRPGYFLTTSVGSHQIDVRNIQSTETGFGELFVYEDVSASVWITQGQTREVTINPRKVFIRGTLALTCDIRDVAEGDSVACQVAIDGVPQEGTVAAGETISTILDPGDHTVIATLVGEHAGLWSPASAEKTFTIREGKTANVSLQFDKRAHLTVTLDQEGTLADFYINGELIAAQVASIEQWLAPNKTYTVEARNITDPAAQGIYEWKDAKTSVYLTKAQEKALELRLKKNWLKGFFEITCDITDLAAGDQAYCLPTIDDVPYDPIPAGETASYPLDPGRHSASVALGPEGAWQVEPVTRAPYITQSTTVRFTASFSIHVPVPTPTPAPDYGITNPGNQHQYLRVETPMGWHEAVEYCDSLGGYLVTIQSAEEDQWVSNLSSTSWLGATDEIQEGGWVWVTGESWDYTNWEFGEPNNCCPPEHCGGQGCSPENYLALYRNRQWNDFSDGGRQFVCEWGDISGDPLD